MRISDWSSDVCSSDLEGGHHRTDLCRGRALHRAADRRDDGAVAVATLSHDAAGLAVLTPATARLWHPVRSGTFWRSRRSLRGFRSPRLPLGRNQGSRKGPGMLRTCATLSVFGLLALAFAMALNSGGRTESSLLPGTARSEEHTSELQ